MIISGEFRGVLCNFCNLNKKKLLFIPIYVSIKLILCYIFKNYQTCLQVHNLAGFDSHLIVKALKIDKSRFSVLPRNAERIVTMSIGNFKFIDSSSFLPESLESLVKNLKEKDPDLFIQTKKLAGESITKFNFLTEKGYTYNNYNNNNNHNIIILHFFVQESSHMNT